MTNTFKASFYQQFQGSNYDTQGELLNAIAAHYLTGCGMWRQEATKAIFDTFTDAEIALQTIAASDLDKVVSGSESHMAAHFYNEDDLVGAVANFRSHFFSLYSEQCLKPISVSILWGEHPEIGEEPVTYRFASQGELQAFKAGIQACEGYQSWQVVDEGYVHGQDEYDDEPSSPYPLNAYDGKQYSNRFEMLSGMVKDYITANGYNDRDDTIEWLAAHSDSELADSMIEEWMLNDDPNYLSKKGGYLTHMELNEYTPLDLQHEFLAYRTNTTKELDVENGKITNEHPASAGPN